MFETVLLAQECTCQCTIARKRDQLSALPDQTSRRAADLNLMIAFNLAILALIGEYRSAALAPTTR